MIAGKLNMKNCDISDEMFMIMLLASLPEEYDIETSQMEKKLTSSSSPLTVEEIRSNLSAYHLKKNGTIDTKTSGERALSFQQANRSGCKNCGKTNHNTSDCFAPSGHKHDPRRGYGSQTNQGNNNNNSDNKKFTGSSNYCGITGHKEADCRKKKAALKKLIAEQAQPAATNHDVLLTFKERERDLSTELIGKLWSGAQRDEMSLSLIHI